MDDYTGQTEMNDLPTHRPPLFIFIITQAYPYALAGYKQKGVYYEKLIYLPRQYKHRKS